MALMSSEKIEALSASAAAVGRNVARPVGRLTKSAMAAKAADRLARRLDHGDGLEPGRPGGDPVQLRRRLVGPGRAGQLLTLNTDLLKVQADAMKPIHKTAVANATAPEALAKSA